LLMEAALSSNAQSLVVGTSGQLGMALVQKIGASALPAARRQLDPAWLRIDLAEIAAEPAALERVFGEHEIDAVYCAAGATDVERCEADTAWAAAANHLGPLALARAANGVPFVFFSTDYVFDGAAGPYAEEDEAKPLSAYGRTKLDGERAILDAHANALVVRTTTVYGPDPQGKNFLYTLRRLLTEGKTMRVPCDQLATPTYVEDLAEAAIALVNKEQHGIFHVAGPEFLSRYDFALQACEILSLDASTMQSVATAELNQKAKRPLLGGLRIDKLQEALGADCMRPIAKGVRDWQAGLSNEKATA
jgi:dTDP-4-dehydrorhamnose reductase